MKRNTDGTYNDQPNLTTPDDLVVYLIETGFVRHYFLKTSFAMDRVACDTEEAEQFLALQLLNAKDKLFDLYLESGINRVRNFVSGLIYRQVHSKKSSFYTTYKKWTMNTEPIPLGAE